jgi:hypothetical protein
MKAPVEKVLFPPMTDRHAQACNHVRSRANWGMALAMAAGKTYSWKLISLGAGAFSGLVTQRVLEKVWKGAHGSTPPPVAADRTATWTDALSWAIATGVGVGVARLLAIRTAARVWQATTHEKPPEPALSA